LPDADLSRDRFMAHTARLERDHAEREAYLAEQEARATRLPQAQDLPDGKRP
jgi:hypothetical protein